jgi:hypothetical protein
VAVSGSNTGRTWTTPVALFTDAAANGEATQASFSTESAYVWRHVKLVAACRNSSGAARESATCSAWLVITFKT